MNVRVEDLSPIKKKLFVEVAADTVSDELSKAYQKIAKTATVKGFRKGKVPKSILKQQYGPKAEYDAIGPLINNSLYKVLIDHQIEAVAQPEVVNSGAISEGEPFTYEAEVEVRPEVVAKDYVGLELDKEKFNFDESVVDQQLQQMAESKVQLEVTERKKAREGDTVIIDFEGFVDGTAFENGAASDYQLELGANSFIPGFEEQVVGMKREDEKEIQVTFPEGYGAKELAGKDAVFKVLLKEIKEKIVPQIDDSLAKELDAENLAELRDRTRENAIKQEQQRIDGELQENLMKTLIDRNPLEVPEGMVDNQLMYLKDSFSERLKAQGMSLEMLGMDDEGFKKTYREMAIQQVQGELLLDAIAKQEDIKVDEAEIDAKMQEFADQSDTPLEQVQKYFDSEQAKNGLKAQLLQEKVNAFLQEKAVISEVEPTAEEPADSAGKEASS